MTDAHDHNIFPFFDLPPELRNAIYSMCVETAKFDVPRIKHGQDNTTHCWVITIVIRGYMSKDLQLACKRIRHEYAQEAVRECEITVLTDDMNLSVAELVARVPLLYLVGARTVRLEFCPDDDEFDTMEQLTSSVRYTEVLFTDLLNLMTPGPPALELHLVLPTWRFSSEPSVGRTLLGRPLYADAPDGSRIPIAISMTVLGDLYEVNPRAFAEDSLVPSTLDDAYSNHTFYRATLSDDPDAYHGLNLEMVEVGEYDYEGAVSEVERHLRWLAIQPRAP